jgi:hypothetical protein
MAIRISWLLPAVFAVLTNLVAAVYVRQSQANYPIQFVIFQIVIAGAALLVAAPQSWVRMAAFLVLLGGVLLTGMSVGMLYIPTLGVTMWLMARRLKNEATPSFLDIKPQNGVIYTESELDEMKYRQSQ